MVVLITDYIEAQGMNRTIAIEDVKEIEVIDCSEDMDFYIELTLKNKIIRKIELHNEYEITILTDNGVSLEPTTK